MQTAVMGRAESETPTLLPMQADQARVPAWLTRIEAGARRPLKVAVLNPVTKCCAYERVSPRPRR
ncbi:hypothetical protein PYK79_55710 [Streptomyces sp. ID05-04B]|nr:hypothetical protein [Streptomyces sp. ID05-04B]